MIIGLLHHLHPSRIHQPEKGVQHLRPVGAGLLQKDTGKAIGNGKRFIRFVEPLDALQDHLIGGQIAFIGHPLKDPAVLRVIEIVVP